MKRIALGIAVAALALAGLIVFPRLSASPILEYRPDDEAMNAAQKEARATVGQIISVLADPGSGQVDLAVKVPFEAKDGTEHMWLTDVSYDGQSLHGRLDNYPRHTTAVNFGDQVSVRPSDISDWKYVENGVLRGGFTIRAATSALPPDQRESILESLPYRLD